MTLPKGSRLLDSLKDVFFFQTIDACKFLLCCQDRRLNGFLWHKKSFRKFGAVSMDHGNSRDGNGTRTKADFLFCKSAFTYLLTQNGGAWEGGGAGGRRLKNVL